MPTCLQLMEEMRAKVWMVVFHRSSPISWGIRIGEIRHWRRLNDLNYSWRHLFEENGKRSSCLDYCISFKCPQEVRKQYVTIKDIHPSVEIKCNKRVAIANMKVDKSVVLKTVLGKPNLGRERKEELFVIINEAIKQNCDMLVMPELAVPNHAPKW